VLNAVWLLFMMLVSRTITAPNDVITGKDLAVSGRSLSGYYSGIYKKSGHSMSRYYPGICLMGNPKKPSGQKATSLGFEPGTSPNSSQGVT